MNLLISDLTQRFGTTTVLDGLSLRTGDVNALVLVGPSGGGKSTLLRILAGLDVPTTGRLSFDGVPLPRDEAGLRAYRRTVGTVFQAYNLFPHLSILDNLTLGPVRARGLEMSAARELAEYYLARVKIPEQIDKYPHQLSGGQQQRVAIARALCMEPRIMLFDEPTSALDPEMIAEVLEVIEELAGSGMTMICVTHEMGFAGHVADQMVFMDHGKIVEMAPPDNFFSKPESERCRTFLQQILRH